MSSLHVRDLGDPFPDLQFPTVDGNTVRMSDFAGTRVLLFSWSSW